jgi:hypothetical protein
MKRINALRKWLKSNNLRREALLVFKTSELQKYAVSARRVSDLKEWFGDNYSMLSFNELFGGSLRVITPFNTKEQRELFAVIRILKANGWEPAGGNNSFNTKRVTQKLRKLDTGEEYEKEVEIADLKVEKRETIIIPAGPKKGEEVVNQKTSSISKVLKNPKSNAPPGLADWWQNHQTEYAKDYNWKQIESAFRDGEITTEHSIIISRDPLDVLRMSDHANIHSCHSEGDSYFECAISESRGNGLVAYLVKTDDLDQLLESSDSEEGSGKRVIKDLDLQEIFEDPQRGVAGIRPRSRVRLRKYVNEGADYEFAAPETRSYGPHPPGFIDRVRGWAWETQKDLFEADEDGEVELPHDSDLKMYGGSYRDSNDGDVLNLFFKEGNIESDYYGNVDTVSENENNVFEMWDQEIEEINDVANSTLNHVSFYAMVDDDGDNNPYVSSDASMLVSIPLSGWEDPYFDQEDRNIKTKSGFRDIPTGWGVALRELDDLLEHNEGGEIEELRLSGDELEFRITFRCDDCYNPDDVSAFYDYIQREIDETYSSYIEMVRKNLVQNGYMAGTEYDKAIERFEIKTFLNFDTYGDEDNDGVILISSKPNSIPVNINLEKLISAPGAGLSSGIIMGTFNTAPPAYRGYKLLDEPQIILNTLNRIAKESYEEVKKQLSLPFLEDAENEMVDYSEAINNLKVELVEGFDNTIRLLNIKVEINVSDSDQHIRFIERFIDVLDQNFRKIVSYIKQSLSEKLKVAEGEAQASNEVFYSGALTTPIVEELKGFPTDDAKRLALWVEKNWNEFNNAEKEMAHYNYLVPTQRDGDYVHDYNSDAPRFWDSMMQRRRDTDISYRWRGSSMKDIMLHSDIEPPVEE